MKRDSWIFAGILLVGFLCAFYGAGCDRGKEVPDSPNPNEVGKIDYRDLGNARGVQPVTVVGSREDQLPFPHEVQTLSDGTENHIVRYSDVVQYIADNKIPDEKGRVLFNAATQCGGLRNVSSAAI